MKYFISDDFKSKIDSIIVNEIKSLNLYIPDKDLQRLIIYIRNKIQWIVNFNVKYVILDYIDKNSYTYTGIGDFLYELTEDIITLNRRHRGYVFVTLLNSNDDSICKVQHRIIQFTNTANFVSKSELLTIENLLDITCYNKILEFLNMEFDYILRKSIIDLGIEVNEDPDNYKDYEDI